MAEPILKLDKYMLIESVGQGGMATVYKARIVGPMGFEKMAAVKLLHAELGSDPEVVRMFIDEARIGGQLSHPNVVNILDFGQIDSRYFIAMEYVDGCALSQLIRPGRSRKAMPLPIEAAACAIARRWFPSVSVEVYSMDGSDYALLVENGLEGVTLYMETYDEPTYADIHRAGRKKDYLYRLDTLERAGKAGVRRLSAGILLGLHDWRTDAVWLALNVRHLQKQCWQSAVSISFPRLRHVPGGFSVPSPMSDAELAQMMVALRLVFPEAGFNLSTREPAALRDRLIHLGVTSMSAGSSTRPGGYARPEDHNLAQFEIEDTRTPAEVVEMISRAGYDPVWKDFDQAFFEK